MIQGKGWEYFCDKLFHECFDKISELCKSGHTVVKCQEKKSDEEQTCVKEVEPETYECQEKKNDEDKTFVREVESEIHVRTNDCNQINNSEIKMPTQPNTLKQQMPTEPITS